MTATHTNLAGARAAGDPCDLLRQMFRAAVDAVDPLLVLPAHLPPPPKGRTLVFGAGKASARMALALERHWQGGLEGLVVTRYGHGEACGRIEIIEAGHPIPDDAGVTAARRMLEMARGLTADDLVVFLISGGGSALLSMPAEGVELREKRQINAALLKSGAAIQEMNCVRKQLSAVKGGRLALACHPARMVTLVISDVPGDDPAVVASGPSIADHGTGGDALRVLDKYGIAVSASLRALLLDPSRAAPTAMDPRLRDNQVSVVATAQQALDAAATVAREHGCTPLILGDSIEGEARDIALMHAAIARQVLRRDQPLPRPCVILSGGETTVTVRGNGRGGRNAEFLLALAIALDGQESTYAIACDTDGIDGTEDNAGAVLRPSTLACAQAMGLDAKASLANNDGYGFFSRLEDLLITGPTRTNVNDFRAILITAG
ncbi:glycerate 2-kinase [Pseudoduganella namucuonensis]|uniref:Glycerate 2-kinase n=2 Tax=Pseudoduganella namucuonensis TaxID=1035707 RepID=A0A1I7K8M8_9BURK|nr:glycerate kinase [Pseudoduganella namucuonensis]SFU93740.1 glycerate 2-kinase [Pseudoduganella namucuonensis]